MDIFRSLLTSGVHPADDDKKLHDLQFRYGQGHLQLGSWEIQFQHNQPGHFQLATKLCDQWPLLPV